MRYSAKWQAELARARAEVEAAEQAKRRRLVQGAAAAVAAVLLVGVAGTSIGLYLANEGRQAARAAELDANNKRTRGTRAAKEVSQSPGSRCRQRRMGA